MKPISQRQIEFKHRLWEEIGQNFNTYTKEMIIEFCDYWFEISYMGKKMKYEKEKTFGIKARLSRWKKNSVGWNKSPEKDESLPNYFNKVLWQKLDPERIQEYKAHLSKLGWTYSTSPGGTFWRSPENKMIWL